MSPQRLLPPDAGTIGATLAARLERRDAVARLIESALLLSANALRHDHSQLASQLCARLMSFEDPEIQAHLQKTVESRCGARWLRPLRPSLTPPGPLIATLEGHTDAVHALSVSSDSRRLLSASQDRTIKLWDLKTFSELLTLRGHAGIVWDVAFTPDGRRGVSASGDRTVRVWDIETGKEAHALYGHSGAVKSIAVAPDSRRAVSGSFDGTIRIWDLERGAEIRALNGHADKVNAVAITADGRCIVSGSSDKTVNCGRSIRAACSARSKTGKGRAGSRDFALRAMLRASSSVASSS